MTTNRMAQNTAVADDDYETIDLLEVLEVVRQHVLIIVLVTVLAAAAGFGVSRFLLVPQYEASALMIVNTRQDATANVTSDQITSATKLVSTYSIIIKSDTVLQQVINNLGLTLTYEQLHERVSVSAVDDTQVMKITVQSDNPEWARQVCEQITAISPDVILESVEAGSVKLISQASVDPDPVSPNVMRNTAVAALLGLVVSVGIVILREMLDNRIKTEDDVRKYLDLPVVGVIPNYEMGRETLMPQKTHHSHRKLMLVGPNAPFQYVEAYKSLRTNLSFLSGTSGCKVILITSSVPEEGKSNVAINLSMTLAEGGKRVLLMDCDLRKGSLSRYLNVKRSHPGISNVIAGQCNLTEAIASVNGAEFALLPRGAHPAEPRRDAVHG